MNRGIFMDIIQSILAILILGFLAGLFVDANAVEQGIYGGPQSSAPYYVVILIILAPGALTQISNITLIRYLRAMHFAENGKHMPMSMVFYRTMAGGAIIGLISQIALQGLVNFLTGLPIMYELLLLSLLSGLVSMLLYELARIWCIHRYNVTRLKGYLAFYEWISVKRESKKSDDADGEDNTSGYYKYIDPDKTTRKP